MEILKYPNPILLKYCNPVTVFGPELKTLLDHMWDTMAKHGGVGLASNQIGLQHQMFVMIGPNNERFYVVNPKIIARSKYSANLREGCLSAPGEYLTLKERSSWVQVKFQDEIGEIKEKVFQDIYAVCFQHEFDHLNGTSHLMSRSLSRTVRKAVAKRWGLK